MSLLSIDSCKSIREHLIFISFVEHWRIENSCPLPLADFLLEQDYPYHAEAVMWTTKQPLREDFYLAGVKKPISPSPIGKQYAWFKILTIQEKYSDVISIDEMSRATASYFDTFIDAIVFYLDYRAIYLILESVREHR